jgi:hypothetical protein
MVYRQKELNGMNRWIVPLLALLLLSGCSNDPQQRASLPDLAPNAIEADDAPVADTAQARESLADLLGLRLGRQWQYQGEGNEYATFTATVAFVKDHYYQIEENNGGTIMARIIALQPDGAYEIFTQGEHVPGQNLLNELNESSGKIDAKKILPWPLTIGMRWSTPDGGEAEVAATNQQHEVPFGKLNQVTQVRITTVRRVSDTATYQVFDETTTVDRYYAKGVGLIEQRFTSEEFIVTSKLEKMTLAL